MSQDYHQHNLRGQVFRDQDLTGANFAGVDISGADFTGTCLINADFSHAHAGLPPLRAICLLVFSLFLALLSGVVTAYAGATFGHLFATPDPSTLMLSAVIVVFLMLFGTTTLFSGLGFALAGSSLVAVIVIVMITAITPSGTLAGQAVLSSLSLGGALEQVGQDKVGSDKVGGDKRMAAQELPHESSSVSQPALSPSI